MLKILKNIVQCLSIQIEMGKLFFLKIIIMLHAVAKIKLCGRLGDLQRVCGRLGDLQRAKVFIDRSYVIGGKMTVQPAHHAAAAWATGRYSSAMCGMIVYVNL